MWLTGCHGSVISHLGRAWPKQDSAQEVYIAGEVSMLGYLFMVVGSVCRTYNYIINYFRSKACISGASSMGIVCVMIA